jgi:LPXTG-motif cell wall-anchored protein
VAWIKVTVGFGLAVAVAVAAPSMAAGQQVQEVDPLCLVSPQLCPHPVVDGPAVLPRVDVVPPEVAGEVAAAQPRVQPAAAGGLPVTGADTVALAAMGGVLLVAGAGLVYRSRRSAQLGSG